MKNHSLRTSLWFKMTKWGTLERLSEQGRNQLSLLPFSLDSSLILSLKLSKSAIEFSLTCFGNRIPGFSLTFLYWGLSLKYSDCSLLLFQPLSSIFIGLNWFLRVHDSKWIRLLFSREFSLENTLRLWDAIFADDPKLGSIDYLCLSLILLSREQRSHLSSSPALIFAK